MKTYTPQTPDEIRRQIAEIDIAQGREEIALSERQNERRAIPFRAPLESEFMSGETYPITP